MRFATFAIAFFLLAYNMRLLLFRIDEFTAFYRAYPWQVGETVWKMLWILVAFVGVMVAHRVKPAAGLSELGLARSPMLPLVAAFVVTLPMLLLFAMLIPVYADLSVLAIWMTAIVSPLSEEVLFRGYLFRQLYERAHWPFWGAVLANAAPFAWGHINQAERSGLGLWGLVLVILITGSGAALFAWVLVKWAYNLWFNIGLHSLMNLWWYVFSVDDTAIGGVKANIARLLTLALAVLATVYRDRILCWLSPHERPPGHAA